MNRAMAVSHLAMAHRHLREGRARAEAQAERIARLQKMGADTGHAEELLKSFDTTLIEMERHREIIAAVLHEGADFLRTRR